MATERGIDLAESIRGMLECDGFDYTEDDTIVSSNLPVVTVFEIEYEGEKFLVRVEEVP